MWGLGVPPGCSARGLALPRPASLAASWPRSWAAPLEYEAMYIPLGRHHSWTLSLCSPYSVLTFREQPDLSPLAREVSREAGYRLQPKHPVLVLSFLPGCCCLPGPLAAPVLGRASRFSPDPRAGRADTAACSAGENESALCALITLCLLRSGKSLPAHDKSR